MVRRWPDRCELGGTGLHIRGGRQSVFDVWESGKAPNVKIVLGTPL